MHERMHARSSWSSLADKPISCMSARITVRVLLRYLLSVMMHEYIDIYYAFYGYWHT